jgi:hypothetical protein
MIALSLQDLQAAPRPAARQCFKKLGIEPNSLVDRAHALTHSARKVGAQRSHAALRALINYVRGKSGVKCRRLVSAK